MHQLIQKISVVVLLFSTSVTVAQKVEYSHSSGYYDAPFELEITCKECDSIKFTTNGNNPETHGVVYKNVISAVPAAELPHRLAFIPTTSAGNPSDKKKYPAWEKPGNYNKANVVRAVAYRKGKSGKIKAGIWFVQSKRHQLPVISLLSDSAGLFGFGKGIHVPGKNFNAKKESIWTGNYRKKGKGWERLTSFEYLDETGESKIRQNVGIRTHGLLAKSFPQKSLRIYARDEYGKKSIKYPLFEDGSEQKYKRLILRSSFSSWEGELYNDALIHNYCKELDIETMPGRPVVLYLNGEYWGIFTLSERLDEEFMANRYDLPLDKIEMIGKPEYLVGEDSLEFAKLMDFAADSLNSDEEVYQAISKQFDISNYIDYLMAEMFFANTDWPFNNVTLWRKKETNSKWRLVLVDLDACMGWSGRDMFEHCRLYPDIFISIFNERLFHSKTFVKQFKKRYFELAETIFSEAALKSEIDKYRQLYLPELQAQIDRWHYPKSVQEWEALVADDHAFAETRLHHFKNTMPMHIKKEFLTPDLNSKEEENHNHGEEYEYPNWWLTVLALFFLIGGVILYRVGNRKSGNK
jgi:hypothetical protein